MKSKLFIIFFLIVAVQFYAVLKVGISLTEPYAYMEEVEDGYILKGIDVEIVKMISQELHENVEIYIFSFPYLVDNALNEGNVDMIIGGIHITPERRKKYYFSIPYLTTGLVLIKLKDNKKKITSFDNIAIGAKKDSTGYKKTLELINSGKIVHLHVYSSNEECLEGVLDGNVDAAFFDLVNALYFSKKYPVEIVGEPFEKSDVGIATKDKILLEKINYIILKNKQKINIILKKYGK
ncbi:hypothetical protein XO10_05325 [Marinitoga sp. 1135]|uniref:Periplasmic component of amino acid ABC-type transporter/signal transduction system n=1 Tax=Marinitoga piezophila (strain DSM 14283 / JCM 11233 / KA3) TaxID=443254 RepID=H2J7Z7_MARPK|nr:MULTISPECIES: transporter substrate-binding domain-containing protein [Marinitoga]AEX85488.1 periplasmic component of amino acid ABC-type transporter/signal transduction system [Marinitoga piezophila KA3]APT75957.1 hypothetical protein LN42_05880 [Marinitoga sp. 1137]NUU95699.1 hypothetical protein [Marinitoga sp. 1135]NUU97631.1 hypothetical protein [Marinitoga sp. 1138]